MGDQEYGETERLLQGAGEVIECRGADGVEAGGGFVEEQQRRIQRERTRQTGALAHAARQLRRQFVQRVRRQPGKLHLQQRQLVQQRFGQLGMMFLQRHLHVFADGQRREQRTVLEQYAGAALDVQAILGIARAAVDAEDFDLAIVGFAQADDRTHQHRLAAARAADHADDLAAPHVEVEVLMHHLFAELIAQPADFDDVSLGGHFFLL